MDFRTVIKDIEERGNICHSHRIMLIGSCFSDNIGGKMQNALMNVSVNPFGTVYNPASILSEISRIAENRIISEDELFHANGMWNNFSFHSHFSRADRTEALTLMNSRLTKAHEHLKQCNTVIITLGTAFVYEHKQSGTVVGNCHKLPAHNFERKMLTVSEINALLQQTADLIAEAAPQAEIIFTVSPIRHIADGLEQNQMSKSSLRVAVGDIVSALPHRCHYFPAYEIMMDDLRDYRFYAADMVHPSEVAVEYIWNAFKAAYFSDSTAQTVARCERMAKRLAHRPMTDNREAIERFRKETAEALALLIREYPYIGNLPQVKKFFIS